MAKSPKVSDEPEKPEPDSQSDATETPDIEDAEVISETAAETAEDADGVAADDDTRDDGAPAPGDEGDRHGDAAPEDTAAPDAADAAPSDPEPATVATAPSSQPPAPQGGGWVMPMLVGAIAVGAGFAIAQYAVPDGWPRPPSVDEAALIETVEAQGGAIAALEAALAERDPGADIDALRGEIAALSDQVEAASTTAAGAQDAVGSAAARIEGNASAIADVGAGAQELGQSLRALTVRLDGLEALIGQMSEGAEVNTAALEALQGELDAAVASAREELAAARAEAAELAAAAKAEADAIESAAAAQAMEAEATAAIRVVDAALMSGEPYTEALDALAAVGLTAPEALGASAADGVPTLPELQAEFPDAARAALDGARRAAAPDTTGDRLMGFLQRQTGARSVVARDGDDPDAVLSRAEAALRAGDLGAALSELQALPPEAAEQMAAWSARATMRQDALAAAAALRGN